MFAVIDKPARGEYNESHCEVKGRLVMQRITLVILLIAFALLVVGLALGDFLHVLANATLLCLSCVGIG